MHERLVPWARILLVPYALFMAFVFFWPVSTAVGPGRSDLVGHLAVFMGLAVLLSLALSRWRVALLVGLVLAVVVETVQLAIPGRTFDRTDMAANVAGVLVVAVAWRATGAGRDQRNAGRQEAARDR